MILTQNLKSSTVKMTVCFQGLALRVEIFAESEGAMCGLGRDTTMQMNVFTDEGETT